MATLDDEWGSATPVKAGALHDEWETATKVDDERPSFLDKGPRKPPEETRPFRVPNTGPDVAVQLNAEAKAAAPAPGIGDAVVAGAGRAASLGFGDELEGAYLRAKDILASRQSTYAQRRDEVRARDNAALAAHPIAGMVGETAGGLATSLIPGAAPARAATAGQAAIQAAKVGAIAGLGNSEADLTRGDVVGAARDTGVGAVTSGLLGGATSKVVRGAPERVDERLVANISRGPAGGAAKDKLYKNVVAKAGEEFEDLNEVLARNPGVKASLVRNAATAPAKSAKLVSGVIDRVDGELTPIYRQIDAGPAPMSAVTLQNRLMELRQRLADQGNTGMADVVEKFEGHLAKHYGDGDAIKDGTKLTASGLRRLKGEVGEIAFKGDAPGNTPFRTRATQLIYGAINETIEEAAAATPGVSVEKMRLLNKDASTLIAVRDALADRGVKDKAGRTSLFQIMAATTMAGGGFAAGGLDGAVLGAATAAGMKAGAPVARSIDFQLAKLVQASRNGSTPAQLGQLAIELGLSRAAADEIQRRGIGALTGQAPPQ